MINTSFNKYTILVLSFSLLVLIAMSVSTIESKATTCNPVAKNDTTPTPGKAVCKNAEPHPTCIMRINDGLVFTAVYNNDRSITRDSLSHIAEGAVLFLDGKPISMDAFWNLGKKKTDEIRSANIWKGKDAIRKFGKTGAQGVVEFFTKKDPV